MLAAQTLERFPAVLVSAPYLHARPAARAASVHRAGSLGVVRRELRVDAAGRRRQARGGAQQERPRDGAGLRADVGFVLAVVDGGQAAGDFDAAGRRGDGELRGLWVGGVCFAAVDGDVDGAGGGGEVEDVEEGEGAGDGAGGGFEDGAAGGPVGEVDWGAVGCEGGGVDGGGIGGVVGGEEELVGALDCEVSGVDVEGRPGQVGLEVESHGDA